MAQANLKFHKMDFPRYRKWAFIKAERFLKASAIPLHCAYLFFQEIDSCWSDLRMSMQARELCVSRLDATLTPS
jgi:hypothetical protein